MNRIKHLATISSLAFALVLGACGDTTDGDPVDGGDGDGDTGGGGDGGGRDGGGGDAGSIPTAPAIKATQVDRMGRAAVATALHYVFEANDAVKGMNKDLYNAAPRAEWAGFTAQFAGNLAIFDALDTVCGNQLLAATGSSSIAAGAYMALAGVLADDRLYVNSAVSACTQYFGVELGMSTDCGGRTPQYDAIDVTYSALAVGATTGVGDTINSDNVTHPALFPYVAAP